MASSIPTFARTEPPDTQVTKSVISLLNYYGWKKFSIIHEEVWLTVANSLVDQARSKNMTVNHCHKVIDNHKCCENNMSCCRSSYWHQVSLNIRSFAQIRIQIHNRVNKKIKELLQFNHCQHYRYYIHNSLIYCFSFVYFIFPFVFVFLFFRFLFICHLQLIQNTKNGTRIYVFLGSTSALIDMMVSMDTMQLFSKGEYMVIFVDMMTYSTRYLKYVQYSICYFARYIPIKLKNTCHLAQYGPFVA